MKVSYRRISKAKLMSRKGLRYNAALILKGEARIESRSRRALRLSIATVAAIQAALQIARIQSQPFPKHEKAIAIAEASIDAAVSIKNALSI